jgi:hypothetical protein
MLILTYIISIVVKIVIRRFIEVININDIEFTGYRTVKFYYYLVTFKKIDIT